MTTEVVVESRSDVEVRRFRSEKRARRWVRWDVRGRCASVSYSVWSIGDYTILYEIGTPTRRYVVRGYWRPSKYGGRWRVVRVGYENVHYERGEIWETRWWWRATLKAWRLNQ